MNYCWQIGDLFPLYSQSQSWMSIIIFFVWEIGKLSFALHSNERKNEGKLNGCTVGCRSKLDVALLMAMKCYVLRVLLLREHSANVHAMVSSELTFYPTSLSTTCGRTVIDMVVAEKDVAEFQFHRYCIHPWGMVCHRLNAVNHIDLACACIH